MREAPWRLAVVTKLADLTVVGAGLTGLAAANLLHRQGLSVRVLEAGQRVGGRIDSVYEAGEHVADLGPTWVWPEYQPIVSRWTSRLELALYDQYEHGLTIVDAGEGQPASRAAMPGQPGSKRIVGGPQALVDSLARTIPADALLTNCRVRRIESMGTGVDCTDELGRTFHSSAVIVAAPARIVARDIQFSPELPVDASHRLSAVSTWMARHAKVVVRYERSFWRDQGLSGRILSRVGPLAEVHDHCDPEGEPAALFGFSAWPHSQRTGASGSFEAAIAAQMRRCFGSEAPGPLSITVRDWAGDELVTTQEDLDEPMTHPAVQPELVLDTQWQRRLWFASAETARQAPGLIAGALESAERVSQAVVSAGSTRQRPTI